MTEQSSEYWQIRLDELNEQRRLAIEERRRLKEVYDATHSNPDLIAYKRKADELDSITRKIDTAFAKFNRAKTREENERIMAKLQIIEDKLDRLERVERVGERVLHSAERNLLEEAALSPSRSLRQTEQALRSAERASLRQAEEATLLENQVARSAERATLSQLENPLRSPATPPMFKSTSFTAPGSASMPPAFTLPKAPFLSATRNMTFNDFITNLNNGSIASFDKTGIPAGNGNSEHKVVTLDGQEYYVLLRYDPVTNQVYPPQ